MRVIVLKDHVFRELKHDPETMQVSCSSQAQAQAQTLILVLCRPRVGGLVLAKHGQDIFTTLNHVLGMCSIPGIWCVFIAW